MSTQYFIKPLILLLLLSQLLITAHAAEHAFEHEEDELCFICIHKTNTDDVTLNSSDHYKSTLSNTDVIRAAYCKYLSSELSLYNNRSPPFFS